MAIVDNELPHLGPEFDYESWDFLQGSYPRLAEKLEREIADGKTPEQIHKACIRRIPRHRHDTICSRLLMAGRHLFSEKKREEA